jgi:hypothetical protein
MTCIFGAATGRPHLADHIAPTNNPALRFRLPAYAISFGKRLSAQ